MTRLKASGHLSDKTPLASKTPGANESGVERALLIGYAAIILIAAFQTARFSLNHDAGTFLLDIRELQEGRPYHDMNMPSNIWLPYVSFVISERTSFYLADIHQSMLFTFSLICTTLVFFLMRRQQLRGVTRFAAVLGPISILLLAPGYDFGQREHLFALSCAPLLALQYNRYAGKYVSMAMLTAVSALAALGASQKPYFILFLVALGGIDLAIKRFKRISLEFVLIYLLTAIYLCWITITYPTYFTAMIPGALKSYGSMRLPLDLTLIMALVVPLASIKLFFLNVAMFGLGSSLPNHGKPQNTGLFSYFIIVGVLSWLLGVGQRFGFAYHFLPFKLFVACASVIIFAWLMDGTANYIISSQRSSHARAIASACSLLVMAYALILLGYLDEKSALLLYRQEALDDPFTKSLQALPRRTPVYLLSSRVTPITPIHAYADIRWTGTISTLLGVLPLTDALSYATAKDENLIAAANAFRDQVNGSFSNPAPHYVFVDVSKVFSVFRDYKHPDVLEFMSGSDAFRKLWAQYEKVGHLDTIYGQELDVYRKK